MTQSERRFSCSIGIDMGAKYTGVFYALFDREELPTNLNSKAMTLVMPETGPRYVQAQRTAVRHRFARPEALYPGSQTCFSRC